MIDGIHFISYSCVPLKTITKINPETKKSEQKLSCGYIPTSSSPQYEPNHIEISPQCFSNAPLKIYIIIEFINLSNTHIPREV